MAPTRKIRTYNSSSTVNNSVDAFNLLMAKNITKRLIAKKKRRKNKFIVKELPKRTEKTILTDDSLQVSIEDTFDKLKRGPIYNKVTIISRHPTLTDSDKSLNQTSFTQDRSEYFDISPVVNRQKIKTESLKTDSDSLEQYFKHSTKESLHSIEVEIDSKKKSSTSLSYLNIPRNFGNTSKTSSNINSYAVNISNRFDESFNKIFSKTFTEKKTINCSTPLHSIKHTISSPIKNIIPLLKKSYDEIKSWEHEFPIVEMTNHFQQTNNSELLVPEHCDFINLRKRKVLRSYTNKSLSNIDSRNHSVLSTETFNESKNCSNSNNSAVRCTSIGTFSLEDFESFSKDNYFHVKSSSASQVKKLQNSYSHIERVFTDEKSLCIAIPNITLSHLDSVNFFDNEHKVNKSFRTLSNKNKRLPDNSNNLVVNLSRQSFLEDFEHFYSQYISQTHFCNDTLLNNNDNCIPIETPQQDAIVNLTNNKFEKFYQNIYSNISEEIQNNEDIIKSKFICKDLVVNIPRREDMFKKFYYKLHCFVESSGRETSETDTIQQVNPELIVNVTKNEFQSCQSVVNSLETSGCYESLKEQPKMFKNNEKYVQSSDLNFCKTDFDGFSNGNASVDVPKIISDHNYKMSRKLQSFLSINNHNRKIDLSTEMSRSKELSASIIEGSFEDSNYKHFKFNKKIDNLKCNQVFEPKKDLSSKLTFIQTTSPSNHMVSAEVPKTTGSFVIDLTESEDESVGCSIVSQKTTQRISDIIDSSLVDFEDTEKGIFKIPHLKKSPHRSVGLKPGKLWRRSLLMYRRSNMLTEINPNQNCVFGDGLSCHCKKCINKFIRRSSIKIVPSDTCPPNSNRQISLLEEYASKSTDLIDGSEGNETSVIM